MELIGLSGYAGSGKDAVAECLAEDGWQRIAFADKLKDLTLHCNPCFTLSERGALIPLSDIVSWFDWDYAKTQVKGVREFLQNLGLGVRKVIGSDTWVDLALGDLMPYGRYVVTDVRFQSEINTLRTVRAQLWRIDRPGTGPANNHISEHEWVGTIFDEVINNDGGFEELRRKVLGVSRRISA